MEEEDEGHLSSESRSPQEEEELRRKEKKQEEAGRSREMEDAWPRNRAGRRDDDE